LHSRFPFRFVLRSIAAIAVTAAVAALGVAGAAPAIAANGVTTDPADGVPRTDVPVTYTAFPAVQDPGSGSSSYFQPFWYDTDGRHIQAHGGQVVTTVEDGQTVYYWYGEDRTNGYWNSPGVGVYRSTDLLNWTNLGTALRSVQQPAELASPYFDALYDTVDDGGEPRQARIDQLDYYLDTAQSSDHTTIFERPKVLHNERTGKWVMWWHSDGRTTPGGSTYARSMAAVAVADGPAGPFRMVGAYRMPNRTDYTACSRWAVPGQARDMTVFQDADGVAYIAYSSEENASLYIARLDDDFTNVVRTTNTDTVDAGQYSEDGRYPYVLADGTAQAPVRGADFQIVKECGYLEAPAVFAQGGQYHVVASGATGWAPNPQTYYGADAVLGTWHRGVEEGDADENTWYSSIPDGGDGLLSAGDVRRTTFGSQATNVLTLGPGRFVYMGDRWDEGRSDSTYVWLPIVVGEGGRLELRNPAAADPQRWANGWDSSYWDDNGVGTGTWTVGGEGIPTTLARGTDATAALPDVVRVSVDGVAADVPVTWSSLNTAELGIHRVVGTLAAAQGFTAGRRFTRDITVAQRGIANLAPSAAVTASARQSLAPTLVDGDGSGKGWDDWSGSGYPRDSTLDFTWDAPQRLDTVSVFTYKDGAGATWPSRLDVQYLDGDGAWVSSSAGADVAQDPSSAAPRIDIDVSALPATTGVRVRLRSAADTWQSISEVQIWGAAPPLNVCTAAGTTVSATFSQTEWATMPASFACDGRSDTAWSTWTGGTPKDTVTFTVTATDPHVLDRVRFTTVEGAISGVDVAYLDGELWRDAQPSVPEISAGTPVEIGFAPVRTRAVRLTFHTPSSYLKIPELMVPEAVVAPTSIDVTLPEAALRVGEAVTASAAVLPLLAPQDVMWESSDTAVATVDASGVVTALAPGAAVISARSASAPEVVGATAVTVTAAPGGGSGGGEGAGGSGGAGVSGGTTAVAGSSSSDGASTRLAVTGAIPAAGVALLGAVLAAAGLLFTLRRRPAR